MIRSKLATTRLIVLPYAVLLLLHVFVVGGGGIWLWHQVRAVESRLLLDELVAATRPLVEQLHSKDALRAAHDSEAWLLRDVERLFATMSALRYVTVSGPNAAYQIDRNRTGSVSSRPVLPLPANETQIHTFMAPDKRLHKESGEIFLMQFDISESDDLMTSLDFAFDRAVLMTRINAGLQNIERALLLFGSIGALSIFIALGITVIAMNTTRRLESHFQEIYQRASLAEMAAQLVHDLRNPLAALRTNVQAMAVAPQLSKKIVKELDQDIVSLNEKLSAFLDLTRRRQETAEPVDVIELINNAVRLAQPVLNKYGLSVKVEAESGLPHPEWQKNSLIDALLNLIFNAAQSGQREGCIRITAKIADGMLELAVEDRGRGIDEKDMPYLFDAFYTTREDGNGLGLAIVQRIAVAHHGRVYLENRSGGGTRAVLLLPLKHKEIPHWWIRMKQIFPV